MNSTFDSNLDSTISSNLRDVSARLAAVCTAAHRSVESITLLAVTKTQSPAVLRAAARQGLHCFGENYVQEALDKMQALADFEGPASFPFEWHFIGPIQSNKTRAIAEHFDWVHSVDRLKIAQRLSEQRPAALPPLQVCLQINIDAETSKSGVFPSEALSLALDVAQLPRLRLRGLMSIPQAHNNPEQQRTSHRALRELLEHLRAQPELTALPTSPKLDTLSMGMSADLEAAITEGSTLVRIGTALFGERKPHA